MKKLQTIHINPLTVLSISPIEEDHVALKNIFRRSESTVWIDSDWLLHSKPTLESALPVLRENQISIVLTERDLGANTWKDVLEKLINFPKPPLLIVSSRTADEYLWSEALNLGAYDVLAKPFDAEEVLRVVESAWQRWSIVAELHRNGPPGLKVAAAAV